METHKLLSPKEEAIKALQAALLTCQQANIKITGVSEYVVHQMMHVSDSEITLVSIT